MVQESPTSHNVSVQICYVPAPSLQQQYYDEEDEYDDDDYDDDDEEEEEEEEVVEYRLENDEREQQLRRWFNHRKKLQDEKSKKLEAILKQEIEQVQPETIADQSSVQPQLHFQQQQLPPISYKVVDPYKIVINCSETKTSTSFQKIVEPQEVEHHYRYRMAKRELKKKNKEIYSDQSKMVAKEEAERPVSTSSSSSNKSLPSSMPTSESPSPVPHILETPPPSGITGREVQQAVDSVLNQSQRVKEATFKLEKGRTLQQLFESFSTDYYDFSIDSSRERLISSRYTTMYPLDLRTFFLPCTPPFESDSNETSTSNEETMSLETNSQLYVSIQPYARAWFDSDLNQTFLQLMAFVRYGWSFNDAGDKARDNWFEPSRVTVKVNPEIKGSSSPCSLQIESIPHYPNRNRLDDEEKEEQEELKNEMKRREYEELYQVSSPNQVTWTMQRRFSRVENFMLDHPDLTVHHTDLATIGHQATLIIKEKDQVMRMMEPSNESFEPYADYINFGVWRWDNTRDISFKFTAQHRVRVLQRFEGSRDKYAATVIDTPTCEAAFLVSRTQQV